MEGDALASDGVCVSIGIERDRGTTSRRLWTPSLEEARGVYFGNINYHLGWGARRP